MVIEDCYMIIAINCKIIFLCVYTCLSPLIDFNVTLYNSPGRIWPPLDNVLLERIEWAAKDHTYLVAIL